MSDVKLPRFTNWLTTCNYPERGWVFGTVFILPPHAFTELIHWVSHVYLELPELGSFEGGNQLALERFAQGLVERLNDMEAAPCQS